MAKLNASVRRLAYEATDSGLLSPDLAAGVRRVRGAKRAGFRIGNWPTAEGKSTRRAHSALRAGFSSPAAPEQQIY